MTVVTAAPSRRSLSAIPHRLFLLLALLPMAWLGLGARPAAAQTVTETFDGYPAGGGVGNPVSFGNFTYSGNGGTNVGIDNAGDLGSPGDHVLLWDSGFTNSVTMVNFTVGGGAPAATFDLHSLDISRGVGEANVRIEGLRGNRVVYSATLNLDSPGSYGSVSYDGTYFGTLTFSGWSGLDEVRFHDNGGQKINLEIDNLEVTWVPAQDADGSVTAAGGVSEPVALPTTLDTAGKAVDIFDFTISDGGTSDGLPLDISQVVLYASGTTTDAERSRLTLRLDGPDIANVTGAYNAGADTYTFSGLSVSVADGGSEIYTVNAYWNDNTGLTDGHTLFLSTDGDTDVTVASGGTQMGTTATVTNGAGSPVDVTATRLAFTTQPAGSVSGYPFTVQPVVAAQDAFGNTDTDHSAVVILTEESPGAMNDTTGASAVNGVATFTDAGYTAAADGESFALVAFSYTLANATSVPLTSDVVATRLAFTTEPAPTSLTGGQPVAFTTVPVVRAVDAGGLLDRDYATDIRLAVTDPNDGTLDGTVNALTGTGDTDGDGTTVSVAPTGGAATFTGLALDYTPGGESDEVALRATSSALTSASSTAVTVTGAPTVADVHISISGATGAGGAFKIGDTVTATWNNTAGGDANDGITSVTVDFSQFGGGAAVVATNSAGTWTATYTLTKGAVDDTNRNVSVTASNGAASTTTADTTNATVDTVAPTVTVGRLSISGASGTGGAFKIGDTVTATWDNGAGGDNNSDTIAGVTVDFSEFGGGAAVAATNSSGTWTATYTLTAGAIEGMNRNVAVTATDNAGNTTTTADATNATVDTQLPAVPSAPDLVAGSDTGASSTDNLTVVTTPTFTGTTEANATVTLTSDQDGALGTTTADGGGNWAFTPGLSLSEATHAITATASDAAGNTSSASSLLSVTIDATAPAAPPSLDLATSSDTGVSDVDNITDDATPTLTGTAEPSAIVALTSDIDGVLGTTMADGSGNWTFSPGGALSGTMHSLTATATDAAGNTSAGSAALSITVADLAPVIADLDGDVFTYYEGMPAHPIDLPIDRLPVPATVTDADNVHFGGGQLRVEITEGYAAPDELSIKPTAPLSLDGTALLHDGVEVGSVFGDTHTLTVSFSASATVAVVQDVVRNVAFANDSDAPRTAPRTVRVMLEDGTGRSVAAEVTVTIEASDDPPEIAGVGPETLSYEEGAVPLVLAPMLTVSDPDSESLQGAIITIDEGYAPGEDVLGFIAQDGISGTFDAMDGTLSLTGAASVSVYQTVLRSVVYDNVDDADPEWQMRTFAFVVSDGTTESTPRGVGLHLYPVNDAPVAADDAATTDEDAAVEIDVLANDTDPDDANLQVVSVESPTAEAGTVTVNAGGTVMYTPAVDFAGEDTFTYTISDGSTTAQATVIVTVAPVNDAPLAADDAATTDEDVAVEIIVLANDADPDGDGLSVISVTQPSNGMAELNGDGTATYTPAADFQGTDAFTYTVSDGNGGEATATVALTIAPVNDVPVAGDDAAETAEDTAVTIDVLANDTDADGDELAVASVTQSQNGNVTDNGDGTLTYTPAADFFGTDTFTYTVSDGHGGEATAIVTLTVTAVNDAPVFGSDPVASVEELAEYLYEVVVSDAEGGALSIAASGVPAGLTFTDGGDGTATLAGTLPNRSAGSYTITLTASDDDLVAEQTFTLVVGDVNEAPSAAADAAVADEDEPVTIDVLANDSDPDHDALSVVAVTQPQAGSVTDNSDETVTYVPAADFFGTDTFTYTVSDGSDGEATATVTVTVEAVNDAPVAGDDAVTTAEDTAVTIDVLANDTDADGDALSVTAVQSPTTEGGTATVSADGTVTYTPAQDFFGSDAFTYTVSDGHGSTDAATVTVTVTPLDDVPVAVDDAYETDEDTPLAVPAPGLLANDYDIEGRVLSAEVEEGPENAALDLYPDGSFALTPDPDFHGIIAFTYRTVGVGSTSGSAEVTVEVAPVNDAPVAGDDDFVVDEDHPSVLDVLANDSDVEADPLFIESVTQPEHGIVTIEGGDGQQGQIALQQDRSDSRRDRNLSRLARPAVSDQTVRVARSEEAGQIIRYTPAPEYNGSDSFTYVVSDGNGGMNEATVTLTVEAVNDAPVAGDDAAATAEDTAVTLDVLANDTDADGDDLSVSAVTQPQNGSTAVRDDGTVTYSPTADFFGTDAFTYTVSDGNGRETTATVLLTVEAVNDAPVATDDTAETEEDTAVEIDILANDTDADSDELMIVEVGEPGSGKVVLGEAGTVTYTPTADFHGIDSFTYTVSDGHGGTDAATVTVKASEVNDAPMAAADEASTEEDTAVEIDVLANDTDTDGDTLSVTAVQSPTTEGGTAVVSADGTVTYTPTADFFGEDTFTYTVSDGHGSEATATITLIITPVNDAPSTTTITAPEDGASVVLAGSPETPVTVTWTVAEDAEGDAVSYRWEAILSEGVLAEADFSKPLLTVETDATSFETTHAALDAALGAAGVEAGASVLVEHRVVASDGEAEHAGAVATLTLTRGVLTDTEAATVPTVFAVGGAYPNPSAGGARVAVDLPWSAEVRVVVYDMAGRQVAVRSEVLAAGRGRVLALGEHPLTTGVYVYRLTAAAPTGTEAATGRFTVVR